MESLVDKELGNNYDSIEVGEMLQVALLCTQYLPSHRPRMSDVVRMLEGDGLAEKWAASHNYVHASANLFGHNIKSISTINPGHDVDNDRDWSSLIGMTMDDDYDAHCMELSGPR